MMKAKLVSVVARCGVALVLAFAACAAVRADSYSPEVLFTVSYGQGDSQVGIWLPEGPGEADGGPPAGPTGIAVGPGPTIYIADRINQCIKCFDERGQLLMKTEGSIDNLQQLAADDRGNVYALGDAGMDVLSKFGPDGKRLWRVVLGEVVPASVFVPGCFSDIAIGANDELCVGLLGQDLRLAILSGDGDFLEARDGYTCARTGRIVSVAAVPGERLSSQVRVTDSEGREVASYVADVASRDPSVFQGADWGFSGSLFDSADCLYKLAHAARPYRIQLTADLRIGLDMIVTRLDPSGRPVAYLRFPSSPFSTGTSLTVDAQGGIYRLAYGPTSVDVIRYRLESVSDDVQELWEFASLPVGDAKYVPLRMLAESLRMDLKWDAANNRATLAGGPPAGAPSRPVTVGPTDAGAIMHYGRLWISTDAVQDKIGVALKTDPGRKVAYLERLLKTMAHLRRGSPGEPRG